MSEPKISCVYYPTTTVLVDDDKSFLKTIQFQLGTATLCKTFSDTEKALHYIQQQLVQAGTLKNIIVVDTEAGYYTHTSGQLPLQYDVSEIYKHAYEQERFGEISVVVVDFAMPQMNGEEFCRKLKALKGNKIKIIMLTGEADEEMAVRLFNAGIIDRFMRKGKPGLDKDLADCIREMQKNYFENISYPLVEGLASDKDSCLGDTHFKAFFDKICQDLSVSSYYLIELSGSFLLFDHAGTPTWLIIKTLKELQEIAEQMYDAEVDKTLVDAVEKGELVPYFANDEMDFYSEGSDIKKYLFKAEKFKGDQEYRYALIEKEPPGFSLDTQKIVSFNDYITSL